MKASQQTPVVRQPVSVRLTLRARNCSRRQSRASCTCNNDTLPPAAESGRRRRELLTRRRVLHNFAACALCSQLLPPPSVQATEWSYLDPRSWAESSPTCGLGNMQSPIALSLEDAEQTNSGAAALTFQYGGRRPACVRDSGHGTMQVHFVGSQAPLLLVGSQQFQMQQFHFHAPSEHSLDGTRSAMEVHMVHRDTYSGQLLVVATLVRDRKAAQPNPALTAALQYVPRRKDGAGDDSSRESVDIPDGVDASWLLPKLHGVYMYSGSLTTPPCAESVMWCVHDATIEVPPQQVLAFSKQFGSNARPLQARNGRRLTYRLI